MRILQVVKQLDPGGAENVVLALLEAAQGRGHDVAVAAAPGDWSDRFRCRKYTVPPSGASPRALLGAARTLHRAIHDFRPDVVHAHNPGMIAVTSIATLRGRGVPTLGTSHGGTPPVTLARHARLFKLAGLPIVSCGPGVTTILEKAGLKVLTTIDNGVAPVNMDHDRNAVRAALGLHPSQAVAAVVGRLTAAKNQDQALRAAVYLPHLTLLVCGDGPERDRLEQLARDLKVADRVRFLGMRSDVRAIMAASEAVVLTSKYEGLPLTLVEAMSEGTPVVATDVIGSRELIRDRENGLLVPLHDVNALVRALQRVLSDDNLVQSLRDEGVRTASDHSRDRMVRRHLELYEQLVSSNRP